MKRLKGGFIPGRGWPLIIVFQSSHQHGLCYDIKSVPDNGQANGKMDGWIGPITISCEDPEGRIGFWNPPGKSQVIWDSIEISILPPPPPPWKMLALWILAKV